MSLRFVSTFLSHSSVDKPLVVEMAKQLILRGVQVWLDRDEMTLGPLDVPLRLAVERQSTMTLFLSKASLASSWCKDELRWALSAEAGFAHLLPVYLDDPLMLVREHAMLRTRFLHADGDRVNQLGYINAADPHQPDPAAAAEQIAKAAYKVVVSDTWTDVAVVLDQRGHGPRRGPATVPDNIGRLEIPALLFRPSLAPRGLREVALGSDWTEMARALVWGLSTALGTLRGEPRTVRVLGNAQASLMWAVGRHFDRTTTVDLFVYGKEEIPVTNRGQDRLSPLSGGDPTAAKLFSGASSGHFAEVAIGVGPREYAPAAQQALSGSTTSVPLLWLECGRIDHSNAMKLVADLVASVRRAREHYNAREIILFWATANHVATLAAANLTPHVIRAVRFMEWDHDGSVYEHVPMP